MLLIYLYEKQYLYLTAYVTEDGKNYTHMRNRWYFLENSFTSVSLEIGKY